MYTIVAGSVKDKGGRVSRCLKGIVGLEGRVSARDLGLLPWRDLRAETVRYSWVRLTIRGLGYNLSFQFSSVPTQCPPITITRIHSSMITVPGRH